VKNNEIEKSNEKDKANCMVMDGLFWKRFNKLQKDVVIEDEDEVEEIFLG